MKTRFLMIALILMVYADILLANSAKGTFTLDDKKYDITAVLAKTDDNRFDPSRKDVLLLLTDRAVQEEDFKMDELDSMAESGTIHGILVRIDDQKEPTGLIVLGVVQRSGNFICEFDATTFQPTHVGGRVFLDKPDESFGRKYTFDIEFDAAIEEKGPQVVEELGTPLPADGGEPFKVYREYDKAMLAGDPEMLKKYLVPVQASRLDDPEAAKMLGLMKMMRAQDVRFVKGTIQADRVLMTVEGKDSLSGRKTNGTVKMIQVKGKWLLEKENWTGSLQ